MFTFESRLTATLEALDRRGFLRSAASALMSGPQLMGAVQKASLPAAANFAKEIAAFKASGLSIYNIGELLVNVVNQHHGDKSNTPLEIWQNKPDGQYARVKVSPEVVTGAMANQMTEDPTWLFHCFTGDHPERLDQFKNVVTIFQNQVLAKLGPTGFVRGLLDTVGDIGHLDETSLWPLKVAAERIPAIGKLLDINVLKGLDPAACARELGRKGVLTPAEVNINLRNFAEQNRIRQRGRDEYETRVKDRSANNDQTRRKEQDIRDQGPQDEANFDRNADLRWQDDGGRVLESKLNKRLAVLFLRP